MTIQVLGKLYKKRCLRLRMFSSRWVIDPSTLSVPSDSSFWWIAATQTSLLLLLVLNNTFQHDCRPWKPQNKWSLSTNRVTNVQSPEIGTLSTSSKTKRINRPYCSGRWEITSPVLYLQMLLLKPHTLVPVPTKQGPDLVPVMIVPDKFT